MGKIVKNIEELVGHTPLFEFVKYEEKHSLQAHLLGKLEYFNPSGSIKDRAALNMIRAAERDGILKSGDTIVENTSGNTGIGLAAFAASRGYKLTVFLEPGQSEERQKMLKAYGTDLRSMFDVPGVAEAMANGTFTTQFYQDAIQAYCDAQPTHHYFINQLANPANPGVHYETTGPEIWNDTDGKVDIFVAGVGTGGTITGTGEYLKSQNPNVKVVAVEPATSPVLSEGKAGPHKIQGIGAGFVPDTLDTKVYDEIIAVENEDAFETSKLLTKKEGILTGISSGAALYAAIQLAKRPENKGKVIVALLPDSGDRYYSTPLFTK